MGGVYSSYYVMKETGHPLSSIVCSQPAPLKESRLVLKPNCANVTHSAHSADEDLACDC